MQALAAEQIRSLETLWDVDESDVKRILKAGPASLVLKFRRKAGVEPILPSQLSASQSAAAAASVPSQVASSPPAPSASVLPAVSSHSALLKQSLGAGGIHVVPEVPLLLSRLAMPLGVL
jgi:hypothetical protein